MGDLIDGDKVNPRSSEITGWLSEGYEQGFCSPSFCTTHDQVPLLEEEDVEFVDGGDPCVYAVRLYAEGEAPR